MIALCCILVAVAGPVSSEMAAPHSSPQAPAFAPGELLVKFRAEVRQEAAADFQAWFGISTRKTFAINGYQLVKLPEGADIEEVLEIYLEDPDVEHAEPNYIVYADATIPDDTEFNKLWGLNNNGQNVNGTSGTADADIDAPEAWDVTTGSSDIVVAVIDSGVDINHPDLQSNIWTNSGETPGNGLDDDFNGYIDDVNGYDFYMNDGDPRDAHGHGTHVAGTIAAIGDNAKGITGVSWSTKIMALRFLDAWGNGTTANAISAIEYANAMGADIINNSWGSSSYVQALKDAIDASLRWWCVPPETAAGITTLSFRITRPVLPAPTLFRWPPATRTTGGRGFRTTAPFPWMWLRRAPTYTASRRGARRSGRIISTTATATAGRSTTRSTAGM